MIHGRRSKKAEHRLPRLDIFCCTRSLARLPAQCHTPMRSASRSQLAWPERTRRCGSLLRRPTPWRPDGSVNNGMYRRWRSDDSSVSDMNTSFFIHWRPPTRFSWLATVGSHNRPSTISGSNIYICNNRDVRMFFQCQGNISWDAVINLSILSIACSGVA